MSLCYCLIINLIKSLQSYIIQTQKQNTRSNIFVWGGGVYILQLRDYCCLEEVVSRENGYDISKLLDQQVQHVARAFLAEDNAEVEILSQHIKMKILDDMLNKRQSTLINATQDVVSNVSIPVDHQPQHQASVHPHQRHPRRRDKREYTC